MGKLLQGLGLTSTVFVVHNPDIGYPPIMVELAPDYKFSG